MSHAMEPFDLKLRLGGRGSTAVSAVIIALFGGVGYAHWKGYLQLPDEFSTVPLGLFCGSVAILSLLSGVWSHFRKKWYRVDPMSQSIQLMSRGIFGTRSREQIPFSQIDYVQLGKKDSRELGGTRSNRADYFPVFIQQTGAALRRIHISNRYADARASSERVALAVRVDLHDNSQPGETRVRKPEELDVTVREILAQEFSHRPTPTAPTTMHAKLRPEMERFVVEIPHFSITKLGPMQKAVWVILAILGLAAAVTLYFQITAFVFFSGFVFLALVYAFLYSETVTLTRESLSSRAGALFLKWTRRIPLSELEELYISNLTESEREEAESLLGAGEVSREIHTALESIVALGSAIVARSDRQTISFGRILSAQELDYILYQLESRIRQ